MAEVVVKMSSDEQKLLRGMQKVIAEQAKVEGGFKKVGAAAKKASTTSERGAKGMVSQFRSVAAALTSVGLGAATLERGIVAAMEHTRQEIDKAKGSANNLEDALRRASQVSVSPQDFAEQRLRRNRLAQEFGVPLADVESVLFTARSEGLSKQDVRTILGGAPAFETGQAAAIAGQVPGLFKGSGLSGAQAVNLVAAASKESRADFSQVGRAFASAAEGASVAGSSPAETGALLSVLSGKFATPQTAADRLRAFGTRVSLDDDLKGKGIIGATRALQSMSPEQRKEFLGASQELNSAFNRISESLSQLATTTAKMETAISRTGTPTSPVNSAVAARMNNPFTGSRERAAMASRRAAVGREVANLELAQGGFETQAVIDDHVAGLKRSGRAGPSQFAGEATGIGMQFMGFNAGATQAAMQVVDSHAVRNHVLYTGLFDSIKNLNAASENLREASDVARAARAENTMATGVE